MQEEFKSAFILFVAIITGSATVEYQTLLKNIPPVFGFLALNGFVVLVFVAIYMVIIIKVLGTFLCIEANNASSIKCDANKD